MTFGFGNFFHQENFEESRSDNNPIEQSQDYMRVWQNPKKTRVVFRGCAKMFVVIVVMEAPLVGQFWVLLLNGFPQTIELLKYLAASKI